MWYMWHIFADIIQPFQIAANLTSSCLALLDNGIAMNGIFCGVTIASVNGKLIVDPTRKIICNTNAIFTFAVKRSAAGTEVLYIHIIYYIFIFIIFLSYLKEFLKKI